MTPVCKTCRKPKAPYVCGLCQEHLCKSCAQFQTETFSALKKVPEALTHNCYCSNCFDESVAGPLAKYQDTMEKARDIIIYTKEQTKLTRLIKRKNAPFVVENCEDEEDVLMRLSFMAVEENYNCLIDVELKSKKLIVGSHKKSIWSGTAVPVTIDPSTAPEANDG